MDPQLEMTHGQLLLYIVIAVQLFCAQRWGKTDTFTCAINWEDDKNCRNGKLICLIRDKIMIIFIKHWIPVTKLAENGKNELLISRFAN